MKILIVDDSRLARKELRGLLESHPQLNIIAEASDVQTACSAINELKPDVVLLDIHLPDGSGFDVLEQSTYTPKVIFTTAYEQHALRAFTINALDYLLKPITRERLAVALERAFSSANTQQPAAQHLAEHVFIRDGEHCHFVKFNELRHMQVEGNYVRVFFRDKHALLARSLNYVEERLAGKLFFRANRQQIINLDFIERLEPWLNDGLLIVMKDGTEIEVSRRQARELKQRLEF